MKFLIESDIHFKDGKIRSDKKYNIIDVIEDEKPDVVLIVGDLTDVGGDGNLDCIVTKNPIETFKNILCKFTCGSSTVVCYYSDDQLGSFKKYINNMEKFVVPSNILLCVGNHDMYTTTLPKNIENFFMGGPLLQPVYEYVRKRENATVISNKGKPLTLSVNNYYNLVYERSIDNLNFICLGLYPDKYTCDNYLKSRICSAQKKILFFHFNLEGPFSDFWTQEEKDYFYDTIKLHKDKIVCIVVGHIHTTVMSKWNDITTLCAGGPDILVCNYENGVLHTEESYYRV